ncbi:hypothetical protein GCM10023187_27160 [Nibrella viscosa]|uniref:Schlafen AlbA-2 domain-containing protein n=1 Tax=Nibrella viscosa TaxID=1084524 RepID=A0ABP8KIE6_9BACT
MPRHQLADLLQQGEGIQLEFKSAAQGLPRNAIETVAAFLNREGGTLLLGIADNGTVEGLELEKANQLCKDLVALANNPNNLHSAHVARLVIEPTEVVLENANRSYHSGPIDPNNFTPYPKNPNIANVFREIGLMDRLGSGVRNVTQYIPHYAQGTVQFIEGDIFRTIVPVPVYQTVIEPAGVVRADVPVNVPDYPVNFPVNFPVTAPIRRRLVKILYDVQFGFRRTAADWARELDVTERTVKNDLKTLRDADLIVFEGADKTGQYMLTEAGRSLLQQTITKDSKIQ